MKFEFSFNYRYSVDEKEVLFALNIVHIQF